MRELQKALIRMGYDLGRSGADGVFGRFTEAAVRSAFSRFGLEVRSDVTPSALSVLLRDTAEPPGGGLKLLQARNYTKGRTGPLRFLCVHVAQIAEVMNAAENLATWISGSNAPHASFHYSVDADSETWSVRDQDTAWHAPGLNPVSIGVEFAGYSEQTPEQWSDAYSSAMLERGAKLFRVLADRHSLPIRFVRAEELRAAAIDGWPERCAGITSHLEVTRARLDQVLRGANRSTHTDPGPNFPWSRFLQLVEAA